MLGWWTWAAMVVVLAAAAVLSFAALRDLAELCRVDPRLSWLLPVAVDAGAAVSTRVWLSGRAVAAERYARNMTWALLASTVGGNALHSGLAAAGADPAWWVAVAVGAVPPAVVGAVVHLAVLVGRAPDSERAQIDEDARSDPPAGDWVGEVATPADPMPAQAVTGRIDRAEELIAAGAGRRRLARELAIPEHQARALIEARRNGNGARHE